MFSISISWQGSFFISEISEATMPLGTTHDYFDNAHSKEHSFKKDCATLIPGAN